MPLRHRIATVLAGKPNKPRRRNRHKDNLDGVSPLRQTVSLRYKLRRYRGAILAAGLIVIGLLYVRYTGRIFRHIANSTLQDAVELLVIFGLILGYRSIVYWIWPDRPETESDPTRS